MKWFVKEAKMIKYGEMKSPLPSGCKNLKRGSRIYKIKSIQKKIIKKSF